LADRQQLARATFEGGESVTGVHPESARVHQVGVAEADDGTTGGGQGIDQPIARVVDAVTNLLGMGRREEREEREREAQGAVP